ncbi:MAG: CoA transferase [Candidatus Onthomonas sp.]|nr:CoA transferase [Candidatus Onthomonas sp.]
MTLNPKSDQGRELFRKLIKDVDILIENYRPGTILRTNRLRYFEITSISKSSFFLNL